MDNIWSKPAAQTSKEFDPFSDMFNWARDKLAEKVDMPTWASPLVNAVDLEYRRRLNFKISLLHNQIDDLSREISAIENQVESNNI